MLTKDTFSKAKKWLSIRYQFEKDAMKINVIEIRLIGARENHADALPKALPTVDFERLRYYLVTKPKT
jgi:hypothetical protein